MGYGYLFMGARSCAQTEGESGIRSSTKTVGCRKNFWLVQLVSPTEQGLRILHLFFRSFYRYRYDMHHAQAACLNPNFSNIFLDLIIQN